MYGMMEGLTSGANMSRTWRNDAAAMEEAAANRKMREEQLAMQKAQHELQMRLMTGQVNDADQLRGLRTNISAGLSAPINNARTFAAQDQDFETAFRLSGEGKDIAPADPKLWGPGAIQGVPDRARMNDMIAQYMAMSGNMEGVRGLRKENDVAEAFKWAATPENQQGALKFLNDSPHIKLKIQPAARDPKTGRPMGFDELVIDDGAKVPLSPMQMQKLAAAARLGELGYMDESTKLFNEVDARLGARIAADNQTYATLVKASTEGRDKAADNARQDTLAQAQLAHYQAQRAAAGRSARGTPVQIYNPTTKEIALWTPQGGPGMESPPTGWQFLRQPQEVKPIDPKDLVATIEWLASRPENKSLNTAALEGKARAMLTGVPYQSALDRAIAADKGGAPQPGQRGGLPVPETPEMATGRTVMNMDDKTFAAYQKIQRGEPTTPQERQLLARAGIQLPR